MDKSPKNQKLPLNYLGYDYTEINSSGQLPSSRDSSRYRGKTPVATRLLNLETIPDMVRVGAVFNYGTTMGPKDIKADKPKTFSIA